MPRAKKSEQPVEPSGETISGGAPAVESTDFVDIYDGELFVRQYSREVHGDNFMELADSYLAGHPKCRKQ